MNEEREGERGRNYIVYNYSLIKFHSLFQRSPQDLKIDHHHFLPTTQLQNRLLPWWQKRFRIWMLGMECLVKNWVLFFKILKILKISIPKKKHIVNYHFGCPRWIHYFLQLFLFSQQKQLLELLGKLDPLNSPTLPKITLPVAFASSVSSPPQPLSPQTTMVMNTFFVSRNLKTTDLKHAITQPFP